jgi:hypothetical protein
MAGTITAASEMTNRFKSARSEGLNANLSYAASAYTSVERTNAVKND